jgi:hypothetical protein
MVGAGLACACESGHSNNIGAIIAVRLAMRRIEVKDEELGFCDFIRSFSTNVYFLRRSAAFASLKMDLDGFRALGVKSKLTAQIPSAGLRRQLIAAVKTS